jgi:hypothetical protein
VQTPHTSPGSLAQADRVVGSLACLDPAGWPFESVRETPQRPTPASDRTSSRQPPTDYAAREVTSS